MTPIQLGDGTSDTNTVPGIKQRTFYAILDDGRRVTLDATNRTVIVDKVGATGKLLAEVTDTTASVLLTGSTGKTAQLAAGVTDCLMTVVGSGGIVDIQTLNCNSQRLYVREFPVCVDGALKKAMFVMSNPYS